MEQAILFVMNFYDVSREDAVEHFWDEIEAYMQLMQMGANNV